jgi:manganese/iron transport system permease protein
MQPVEAFLEPLRFQFIQHALWAVLFMGILNGVLGSFVVLRGWSFFGDALVHAVFPGVVIAFVVGGSTFLGALIAGLATALTIGAISSGRRVSADSAIGVLFVGAFALGVFLISRTTTYRQDLNAFLFGQILGVSSADVLGAGAITVAVLIAVALLYKEFKLVAFDPTSAGAMGYPVLGLDLALLALLTVTIVVSLRTVGNILVLAMVVSPAATARFFTTRLSSMMVFAATLGALEGVGGLLLAAHLNVPPGSTIVLLATAAFLVGLALSPDAGLPSLLRRRHELDEIAEVA